MQPVGRQLVEVALAELLAHRLGEAGQRADRVGRAEHRRVVDDGALRCRQLVDAGGDERPQRAGQIVAVARRGEAGQLDEEQRVPAAAGDEVGDDRLGVARCRRRSRMPHTSVVASSRFERPERDLHDERSLDRRRPDDAAVGPLRRDEQERQVRQRAHDDAELVAQRRIGPLQVVDDEHGHRRLGVAPHHLGQRDLDGVLGPGGVELVERRRVPEQVADDVEVSAASRVVGVQAPQLLRPAPG